MNTANTKRILQTHRTAKKVICDLFDNKFHVIIIHYSCESFYDYENGKTPRITSIAVRYLQSGQTKSFSIHKEAEIDNIPSDQIERNYNSLEKKMLKSFFAFVKEHSDYKWIHWNMRDVNYGFEALVHRASILKIGSTILKDENKYDLAKLLIEKYGKEYSNHPRLTSILSINSITPKHYLSGEEEANAFNSKNYVKLHQSTLAKVDAIEKILRLSATETLKTKARLYDIYGLSPQGIYELCKENWFFNLLYGLIMLIIGAFIGSFFY